ncbi:MAG TPA: alpha/beta hydrolase [Pelomicrobium sp.]|nr:alpha/beta hydrolase [Pelomicrobium sp.]
MNRFVALPAAVSGERHELDTPAGRLSYYTACPDVTATTLHAPLLLVHSINAAGSAYEMRPLYEHYRASRTVYALELPGFGFSERSERDYTPRLMTDAILAMVQEIRRRHGAAPFDALALSLSSEFLARSATEAPEAFHTLALVSPTGFNGKTPRRGAPGSHRGMPWLYKTFTFPLWNRGFYKLLTSRRSIRFFLRKTFGSKEIDEGLWEYDWLTSHQPGARHAPYYFVSGFLFSGDIRNVYEQLQMPVWMSHGVRGDFTDYRQKKDFEGKANWTIEVFQTGALPHFEVPDAFIASYDAFLAGA